MLNLLYHNGLVHISMFLPLASSFIYDTYLYFITWDVDTPARNKNNGNHKKHPLKYLRFL